MMTDAPDSCHSWVVAAACFVVYFMNFGILRVSGLLFFESLSFYGVDREHASMPFVISYIVRCLAGPVSGYLSHTLGFRVVIIFGCFLSSLGVFACSFVQDIRVLYVLFGVYGLGCGLATSILAHVINLYFNKHVSKAYGISMAGPPASGILLPPVTVEMLQLYGIQGTFLNLSAIMLHTIPAALLLKNPNFNPLEGSLSKKENCEGHLHDDEKTVPIEDDVYKDYFAVSLKCKTCSVDDWKDPRRSAVDSSSHDIAQGFYEKHSKSIYDETQITYTETKSHEPLHMCLSSGEPEYIFHKEISAYGEESLEKSEDTFCQTNESTVKKSHNACCKCGYKPNLINRPDEKKHKSLHVFSILWDPVYITIAFPRCYLTFLYLIIPTILVDFSTDKGVSVTHSTYLLIVYSIADLFGRVCLGWITDGNYISRTRYTALCYSVLAAGFALMVWANRFIFLMFAVILVALGIGAVTPALPGILAQYIAKDKQAMAIASSDIFLLPLSFSTSPLIGYFRDDLGSYDGLIYILSTISIFCTISFLLLPSISNWRMNRKMAISK